MNAVIFDMDGLMFDTGKVLRWHGIMREKKPG